MKKKIIMLFAGLVAAVSVHAQYLNDSENVFSEGKWYVSASGSSLGLGYHKFEKFRLSLEAKGGYLFYDDWMVTGKIGYDNATYGHSASVLGAGIRYYIEQNGLYLGASANYVHENSNDYLNPEANVGYAFFLNRHVTIEPELYYELYSKNNSELSGFGVRLGLGFYF